MSKNRWTGGWSRFHHISQAFFSFPRKKASYDNTSLYWRANPHDRLSVGKMTPPPTNTNAAPRKYVKKGNKRLGHWPSELSATENGESSPLPLSFHTSFTMDAEWNTSNPSPIANLSVASSDLGSASGVTSQGSSDASGTVMSARASQRGTSNSAPSIHKSLTLSSSADTEEPRSSVIGHDLSAFDWDELIEDSEFVHAVSLRRPKIQLRWTQLRNLMKSRLKNYKQMTLGGGTFFWDDDDWLRRLPPLNKGSQVYHAYAVRTIARLIRFSLVRNRLHSSETTRFEGAINQQTSW